MSYLWQLLRFSGQKPLGRSSHTIDVIDTTAYVMGGEHESRVPIGSKVWCLDIPSVTWSPLSVKGEEPPARNAAASAVVDSAIYLFGGRQGIAMGENSLNDLHRLDTSTATWSPVSVSGDVPEARSYHSMTAIGTTLYVFGGCSATGRLNDLSEFDTTSGIWRKLPSSDAIEGRGGTGLTSVGKKLYVVGGFAGREMSDLHEFDTERRQWREIKVNPSLPARSVFGIVSLGSRVMLIGGEVEPSSDGHAGAGGFSNEVWVFDTQNEQQGWQREVCGESSAFTPRGWFPSAVTADRSIIVFGGHAPDNTRLDDTLILQTPK